ncbi:hypothetical protein [Celeribacter sp. PS-C1]|uniref:hypothetical protein n=1 Tax=Celeribacter sp. PS-C1 TaxID=2820813 RepID=UPI001CA5A025|nr:hypothetical protein [Celeribacter sp. PS-C1]MBW6418035.1 hypothetical protein [Celeribacter sp. PS-C1]
MASEAHLNWRQIDLLETALAEYVERYGMTDRVRDAFTNVPSGEGLKLEGHTTPRHGPFSSEALSPDILEQEIVTRLKSAESGERPKKGSKAYVVYCLCIVVQLIVLIVLFADFSGAPV